MIKAKDIAQALKELEGKLSPDELVQNLVSFLKRKGALKLLPQILFELEKLKELENISKDTLVVASQSDAEKYSKGLSPQKTEIDSTLIGGYIYKTKNKRVLNSYKHHLLDLYRKIIS